MLLLQIRIRFVRQRGNRGKPRYPLLPLKIKNSYIRSYCPNVYTVLNLGHSLNPGIDVGQIEGAFVMGMGMVTTEQLLRNYS